MKGNAELALGGRTFFAAAYVPTDAGIVVRTRKNAKVLRAPVEIAGAGAGTGTVIVAEAKEH